MAPYIWAASHDLDINNMTSCLLETLLEDLRLCCIEIQDHLSEQSVCPRKPEASLVS